MAISGPVGFLNETERQSHKVLCAAGSAKEMGVLLPSPDSAQSLAAVRNYWEWLWEQSLALNLTLEQWEGRQVQCWGMMGRERKNKCSLPVLSSETLFSLFSSSGSKCKPGSLQCCLPLRNSNTHTQAYRKPYTNLWINGSTSHPNPLCKSDNKKPGFRQGKSIIWGLSSMV